MSATHLPWRVTEYGEVLGANGRTVVANGFATVASPGDWQNEARANAVSIVLAVNSHDELVSVVASALPVLEATQRLMTAEAAKRGMEPDDTLLNRMRAALAKASASALHSTEGERK